MFKSDSARADSSSEGRRREPSCSARKGGAITSIDGNKDIYNTIDTLR